MALPPNLATNDVITEAWVDAVVDSLTAATPGAWTTLPLAGAWVAFDVAHTPQYRKLGDVVEIRGLIKSGATGSAFTLPAGFRPFQSDETFAVVANNAFGQVSISASTGIGTVTGSATFTYLSGIRFSTVA